MFFFHHFFYIKKTILYSQKGKSRKCFTNQSKCSKIFLSVYILHIFTRRCSKWKFTGLIRFIATDSETSFNWKRAISECPKECFPNILETWLLCLIFVFWVRDFKFWLLAYLLIFFDYAKFQKDWTTFLLDILQGSPLWIFGRLQKQKISKGGSL